MFVNTTQASLKRLIVPPNIPIAERTDKELSFSETQWSDELPNYLVSRYRSAAVTDRVIVYRQSGAYATCGPSKAKLSSCRSQASKRGAHSIIEKAE